MYTPRMITTQNAHINHVPLSDIRIEVRRFNAVIGVTITHSGNDVTIFGTEEQLQAIADKITMFFNAEDVAKEKAQADLTVGTLGI